MVTEGLWPPFRSFLSSLRNLSFPSFPFRIHSFPFLTTMASYTSNMSDEWTPVISPKDRKEAKRLQKKWAEEAKRQEERLAEAERFVNSALEIVKSKNVYFNALVDMPKAFVNNNPCGTMRPVTVSWPAVTKQSSYLLSECVGSTAGKDLLPHTYMDEYAKFAELVKNYPVPIYHIDYKTHEDMGYDHTGCRAPYIDSYTIHIWTYAADQVPVVHKYDLNVDGYKKQEAPCYYRHSYSPVDMLSRCKEENYEAFDAPDLLEITRRMMELAK